MGVFSAIGGALIGLTVGLFSSGNKTAKTNDDLKKAQEYANVLTEKQTAQQAALDTLNLSKTAADNKLATFSQATDGTGWNDVIETESLNAAQRAYDSSIGSLDLQVTENANNVANAKGQLDLLGQELTLAQKKKSLLTNQWEDRLQNMASGYAAAGLSQEGTVQSAVDLQTQQRDTELSAMDYQMAAIVESQNQTQRSIDYYNQQATFLTDERSRLGEEYTDTQARIQRDTEERYSSAQITASGIASDILAQNVSIAATAYEVFSNNIDIETLTSQSNNSGWQTFFDAIGGALSGAATGAVLPLP